MEMEEIETLVDFVTLPMYMLEAYI